MSERERNEEARLVRRLVGCLEEAPPLVVAAAEAETFNAAREPGSPALGIPLEDTRVRVRRDSGLDFWHTLADLYALILPTHSDRGGMTE